MQVLVAVDGPKVFRERWIIINRGLRGNRGKRGVIQLPATEERHDGQHWWLASFQFLLAEDACSSGIEVLFGSLVIAPAVITIMGGDLDFARFRCHVERIDVLHEGVCSHRGVLKVFRHFPA